MVLAFQHITVFVLKILSQSKEFSGRISDPVPSKYESEALSLCVPGP
jgi:hypothetical protein